MPKPYFTRTNRSYCINMFADQHALALKHGLDLMVEGFVCSLCEMCSGKGTQKSWAGACKYCEGTGLTQAFGMAATDSQRFQVLYAAKTRGLLGDTVEVV